MAGVTDAALYALCVYVPRAQSEAVKAALFAAGAGRLGAYDSCCWETTGTGQFRPLAGSRPALGSHGVLERVEELRIEMICAADALSAALDALRAAHPYETPASAYWPINPAMGDAAARPASAR